MFKQKPAFCKPLVTLVLCAFIQTNVISAQGFAKEPVLPFVLPLPGVMVRLSPPFTPAYLKGIIIHPENALKFDFIIHRGDKVLSMAQKKEEYNKLIKYFLASLAIPDEDQWVNLSPYEKNRIIKEDFGLTEMGRDLLGQDYLLKQITASLIYPQEAIGRKFWDRVYTEAMQKYGTTNIPVNTFNKVWIVPDDALIYEKGNGQRGVTAYVLKNHLKVMLEEDYLALQKQLPLTPSLGINTLSSQIVREIVLPELTKEVNEDKNFAILRQVYSGMLLAAWFKRSLKESLLSKIYANKSLVKGVDQDPKNNDIIYHQYLKAYRKGVFNFIKEDVDRYAHETIARKYFSGGTQGYKDFAQEVQRVSSLPTDQMDAAMNAINADDDLVITAIKEGREILTNTKLLEAIKRRKAMRTLAEMLAHRAIEVASAPGNSGKVVTITTAQEGQALLLEEPNLIIHVKRFIENVQIDDNQFMLINKKSLRDIGSIMVYVTKELERVLSGVETFKVRAAFNPYKKQTEIGIVYKSPHNQGLSWEKPSSAKAKQEKSYNNAMIAVKTTPPQANAAMKAKTKEKIAGFFHPSINRSMYLGFASLVATASTAMLYANTDSTASLISSIGFGFLSVAFFTLAVRKAIKEGKGDEVKIYLWLPLAVLLSPLLHLIHLISESIAYNKNYFYKRVETRIHGDIHDITTPYSYSVELSFSGKKVSEKKRKKLENWLQALIKEATGSTGTVIQSNEKLIEIETSVLLRKEFVKEGETIKFVVPPQPKKEPKKEQVESQSLTPIESSVLEMLRKAEILPDPSNEHHLILFPDKGKTANEYLQKLINQSLPVNTESSTENGTFRISVSWKKFVSWKDKNYIVRMLKGMARKIIKGPEGPYMYSYYIPGITGDQGFLTKKFMELRQHEFMLHSQLAEAIIQRMSGMEVAGNIIQSIRSIPRKEVIATVEQVKALMRDGNRKTNSAMLHGGIDFNADHLNLQIKRDGKGVPLPLGEQNLANIHINGLVPVILEIKPAQASIVFPDSSKVEFLNFKT